MAPKLSLKDTVRAAAIARHYFLEGGTKTEIASKFGLSRFQVARILQSALDSGLVTIEIRAPSNINVTASEALRETFGLHHALVVDVGDEVPDVAQQMVGRVAADLLADVVEEGDVLGVSWGRTLSGMVASLSQLPRCSVVQLGGAVGGVDLDENSVEAVRRLAGMSGGKAYPIYAPLIVPDPTTAAQLRRIPDVIEATREYDRVTKAVVAVGSWDPPDSRLRESMTPRERDDVRRQGVVAEVSAVFLDANGDVTCRELANRCVAITAQQLRAVPEIIAVAGGAKKREAIRAVLVGGFATSLVTDNVVADYLLEHQPPARAQGHPRAA
jgi:DNA-binding transcriptional regulator LsrR (DeoR family)